jgi:hypothetical protein
VHSERIDRACVSLRRRCNARSPTVPCWSYEDHADSREFLDASWGAAVFSRGVTRFTPSIVIADTAMPQHDGLWLLRERRHQLQSPIAAEGGISAREACLSAFCLYRQFYLERLGRFPQEWLVPQTIQHPTAIWLPTAARLQKRARFPCPPHARLRSAANQDWVVGAAPS